MRLNSKVKQNKLSLGITCELVKDPILMLLQGENYIIHSTHTDLCSQLECNNLISPQFNTSHSDVDTKHLNIIYELLNLNPCFGFKGRKVRLSVQRKTKSVSISLNNMQ